MTSRTPFDAVVRERIVLGEHLVRLVLEAPEGFTTTGVPDEWVALTVPGQFQTRYYTVRSLVDGLLTIDVVVHEEGLVTEWAQYLELDWSKFVGLMRTPILLDGRHVLDADRMRRLGYRYVAVSG